MTTIMRACCFRRTRTTTFCSQGVVSRRKVSSAILVVVLFLAATCTSAGFSPASSSFSSLPPPPPPTVVPSSDPPPTMDLTNHPERLMKETIAGGRVYQQRHFLTESQVTVLLDEIAHLEASGAFSRSGLSNTAAGKQQAFGQADRSVGVVPWWNDALLMQSSSSVSSTSSSNATSEAILTNTNRQLVSKSIAEKLNHLRLQLAQLLHRPTMANPSLAHECYYSTSTVNAVLPRHMDERHEELKGAKGWLLPSRRSLSWLVYLTDDQDWTIDQNGGALRTFPQAAIIKSATTTTQHDGNLQVGWLASEQGAHPVFLNSWYMIPATTTTDSGRSPPAPPEPHCVLYMVGARTDNNNNNDENDNDDDDDIQFLTKPWLSDAVQGMSISDFIQTWAERDGDTAADHEPQLFFSRHQAQRFYLLEDRAAWDQGLTPHGAIVHDINPERGSLVIFDSVLLPHQVERVQQGHRAALAGWFHEETQPFPPELLQLQS